MKSKLMGERERMIERKRLREGERVDREERERMIERKIVKEGARVDRREREREKMMLKCNLIDYRFKPQRETLNWMLLGLCLGKRPNFSCTLTHTNLNVFI